jgi:phenylalanyl-tRNA synthetase beta chain
MEKEQSKKKENLSEDILYRIEVPANRYDLLCPEGLSMALRVFLGLSPIQNYEIKNTINPLHTLTVDSSVKNVRPFGLAAILRNITFTNETLINFMELQDKLHSNVCRGRSLVSMGTHDLDTVKGPFTYKALSPEEIKFVPLKQTVEMTGSQLMTHLNNDPKLKHFTHLLKDEPLYPVFLDSNGVIMSLPPMINSEHSKLTVNTKNVFIDITAKDLTKAKIVLNTLCAMFSLYCGDQFTVEQVEVISPEGEKTLYPDFTKRVFKTDLKYIRNITGINDISTDELRINLNKMGMKMDLKTDGEFEVEVPITRTDVLHACDIAEDVAISYGYNNITKKNPETVCNGYQQPVNKLTDLVRFEMAASGYIECLTMSLISQKDMFTNMLVDVNQEVLSKAVQIFKSKTPGFEVFRTNLIPGILKTIEANKIVQVNYFNLNFNLILVNNK